MQEPPDEYRGFFHEATLESKLGTKSGDQSDATGRGLPLAEQAAETYCSTLKLLP